MGFYMLKLTRVVVAAVSGMATFGAMAGNIDRGFPFQPSYEELLHRGAAWTKDERQAYMKEQLDKEFRYRSLKAPSLGDWRNANRNWSPYACDSANLGNGNTGVWINNTKKPMQRQSETIGGYVGDSRSSNTPVYRIAQGSPFEVESKNYARAGLKRFAKYYHSFQAYPVAEDIFFPPFGNQDSILVDKTARHDYTAFMSFDEGTYSLNSLTYSDFEIFIGIDANLNDFNQYGLEEFDLYKAIIDADWGTDIYMSDCGFSKVIVEKNTRPTIGGISASDVTPPIPPGDRNTRLSLIREYRFSAGGVSDEHTVNDNLDYRWEIDGVTYQGKNPKVSVYTGVPAHMRVMDVTVYVSDGALTGTRTISFNY